MPIGQFREEWRVRSGISQLSVGGGVARQSYLQKIIAMFGTSLIGYWPMGDEAGTVAVDYSGNGYNGVYTGVTLGQEGIGDGLTCTLFDGTGDFMQPPAGFRSAFNNQELTVAIFGIISASTWSDGAVRRMISFRADASNWVTLAKTGAAGTLAVNYIAGGTNKTVSIATGSPTTFFHLEMTVSKSGDQMKAYFNGIQSGSTQTGLGVWDGALVAAETLVGAQTTTPAQVMSGNLAHCIVLGRVATASESEVMATK